MGVEVTLPELAEGIQQGDVVQILVRTGDRVEAEQPLLEVETDKAVIPIPAPTAGVVVAIQVREGETVQVGQPLLVLETNGVEAPSTPPAASKEPPASPAEERGAASPLETTAPSEVSPPSPESTRPSAPMQEEPAPVTESPESPLPASPAVRQLARELGVNLREVQGTGPGGRIQPEDVYQAARGEAISPPETSPVSRSPSPPSPERPAAPLSIQVPTGEEILEQTRWGPVRRMTLPSLRRKIAQRVLQAWTEIPHVHQFHEADVTELEALRRRQALRLSQKGIRLTLTVFLLKALAQTLRTYPHFNAELDPRTWTLTLKDYCHIGVAVDTPDGLIVPVLRDVDRKGIPDLARELEDLARRTRERKITPEELEGGCFTLSNLGGIGGTHFTPIIRAPEVGILGVGRTQERWVFQEEHPVVRRILPLCLASDHRVVDGADGARFLQHLVDLLENPEALLLGI